MDGLIQTFHIDWRLLIAQFVNFAIVFFILHKFVFIPLSKNLSQRKEKIMKSLEDAEKAKHAEELAKENAEKIIFNARQEANGIIRDAREKYEEILLRAKKDAEEEKNNILSSAKREIEKEKENAEKELIEKVSYFIPSVIQKIFSDTLDEEFHHRYFSNIQDKIKKIL